MKFIMGLFGLVFIGLALSDFTTSLSIFPVVDATYIIGAVFKAVVSVIFFSFAFQKQPTGV